MVNMHETSDYGMQEHGFQPKGLIGPTDPLSGGVVSRTQGSYEEDNDVVALAYIKHQVTALLPREDKKDEVIQHITGIIYKQFKAMVSEIYNTMNVHTRTVRQHVDSLALPAVIEYYSRD